MQNSSNGATRERVDFSKIKTSIPIPNLIEVQKKSYERFLQMDLLPSEREDTGLQSVFNSVFPISDFRGLSQLEFVDYSIGNWECKCGNLKGLHHLRSTCRNPSCGATIRTDPFHAGEVLCHRCGTFNKNIVTFCNRCGDPVDLQLKYGVPECEERGMTYAAPLKVTIRLTVYDKDPETGAKSVRDIKEQEVFFGTDGEGPNEFGRECPSTFRAGGLKTRRAKQCTPANTGHNQSQGARITGARSGAVSGQKSTSD